MAGSAAYTVVFLFYCDQAGGPRWCFLGVGTAGPRGRHDRPKIHLKRRFLIQGDAKVIHADSWADLGSSHHFMHNGQEINLE